MDFGFHSWGTGWSFPAEAGALQGRSGECCCHVEEDPLEAGAVDLGARCHGGLGRGDAK